MKYLAWTLIIAGLISILCEFESYRRSYTANVSKDIGQPSRDADENATPFGEGERFIYLMGAGIVAISAGLYLRSRARSDSGTARLAERLTITRLIFCPNCGRPLRINESTNAKLLGFIPRLICGECKVGTEWSGAAIFGVGFVLAFSGFLFIEAISLIAFILIFAGLVACLIGIVRWERQSSKAKRYIAQSEANAK